MKNNLYISALLLILLGSGPLLADVFKYVDENGNIVFTDSPPPEQETEEVDLPQLQTSERYNPPISVPRRSNQKKSKSNSADQYEVSLNVANGEAIRANSGILAVSASVDPQPNFPVSTNYYLDGNLVATAPGLSSSIEGVDRGDHNIRIEVVDSASGAAIGSASSQITVLRASLLRR